MTGIPEHGLHRFYTGCPIRIVLGLQKQTCHVARQGLFRVEDKAIRAWSLGFQALQVDWLGGIQENKP